MSGFLWLGGVAHPASLTRAAGGGYAMPDGGAAAIDPGAIVATDGDLVWVHLDGRNWALAWQDAVTRYAEAAGGADADAARAPMPGAVVSVAVGEGDRVAAGDPLVVIESMKLETTVRAPRNGVVATVHVSAGQTFERDALLVTLADEGRT